MQKRQSILLVTLAANPNYFTKLFSFLQVTDSNGCAVADIFINYSESGGFHNIFLKCKVLFLFLLFAISFCSGALIAIQYLRNDDATHVVSDISYALL